MRASWIIMILMWTGIVDAVHFNGGTISWVPVDPLQNGSSITIILTQTYYWTYPLVKCDSDVPISSPGRSNEKSNLSCVVDCANDGGYSLKPITMLTDCISASAAGGLMTSQRSTNLTLTAGAYFRLAYLGSAWKKLNTAGPTTREWSIVSLINLIRRPDGLINTPPVASVVSPQYVIVNRTTDIPIRVSDANNGDDIRCRWGIYISGYRRRKRSDPVVEQPYSEDETPHNRFKRTHTCSTCGSTNLCRYRCFCNCSQCFGTTCNSTRCNDTNGCPAIATTTLETPGTLRSTSTYPVRQAIDECGDVCYPNSVPNGTSLSNCRLTFRGLVPGAWYAVALQIEDFMNSTSTTPMSSVPLQFLVYVMPEVDCDTPPVIQPINDCLLVEVGVVKQFQIAITTSCSVNESAIGDILISQSITGMIAHNLTRLPMNSSIVYQTFTWTPTINQVGLQEMCIIAYTTEQVQSTEYCVTFNVSAIPILCPTSTTTSTTTSSTSATSSTSTSTTSTTSTSSTSSTVITTTVSTTTRSQSSSGKREDISKWILIGGISSLMIPLVLCTIYCFRRYVWNRNKDSYREDDDDYAESYFTMATELSAMNRTSPQKLNNPNGRSTPQSSDWTKDVEDVSSPKLSGPRQATNSSAAASSNSVLQLRNNAEQTRSTSELGTDGVDIQPKPPSHSPGDFTKWSQAYLLGSKANKIY